MFIEHVLDEVECESTESVSVSDVDPSETSIECELEEASEALALEVESACDVAEDSCIGVGDSEGRELSLEIGSLLAGADAGIDGVDALRLLHRSFRDSCFVDRCDAVGSRDGGDVEEYLPDAAGLQAFDVAFIGPLFERAPMDAKDRFGLLGLDKFGAHAVAAALLPCWVSVGPLCSS